MINNERKTQNKSRAKKNDINQSQRNVTPTEDTGKKQRYNHKHAEIKANKTRRIDDDRDKNETPQHIYNSMEENEQQLVRSQTQRETQINENENEKLQQQIENTFDQVETEVQKKERFSKPLNEVNMNTILKNYLNCKSGYDQCSQNSCRAKINLRRCLYSVVQDVARAMDMEIVRDESLDWDVYWSDASISSVMSKNMRAHQRISHFPGLANLESKSYLAFHLNRMLERFPNDYNIYPKSWIFPQQTKEFYEQSKHYKDSEHTFIIKPTRGAEGKGIIIFKDIKEAENVQQLSVCQIYISNLLLMDGFKFDLRLYVLISSIDPLRIYVYNNGIVRLATCKYKCPESNNICNQFMHLTNYSINKHSTDYNHSEENGSKRDFDFLRNWFMQNGYNESKLWKDIDDLVIKTLISAYPILRNKHETLFSEHEARNINACFEILGFDVLINENLKPFLLEVNRSPSFNISGIIDHRVKRNLILDTFQILNLNENRRCMFVKTDDKYDTETKSTRLSSSMKNKLDDVTVTENTFMSATNKGSSRSGSASTNAKSTLESMKLTATIKEQIKWELKNHGNYRLIYPNNDTYKYTKYFNHSFTLNHIQDNIR